MRNQWEPGNDLVDLRDIIARMEELNDLDPQDLELDDIEFLQNVRELENQLYDGLENAADNDPIMIRESYFEDYAREFAEEIGAIQRADDWPNYCIDWERAARELAMDFSEVEFGGFTYYIR